MQERIVEVVVFVGVVAFMKCLEVACSVREAFWGEVSPGRLSVEVVVLKKIACRGIAC